MTIILGFPLMLTNSTAGSTLQTTTVQFEPQPYKADGAVTLGAALQLIGLLGLLGVVLGVVASLISQFFYLVLLFPIAIGGCIAAVGSKCIKWFHVRNPLLCGFAGFFAGCLAMLTMHIIDFQVFEANLAKQLGEEGQAVQEIALRLEEIRAHWDDATEDEQAVVTELEKNPEGLRALRANTVWRFIDMQAHQGVEIQPGGGGGRPGLNLGYTGSYIYWGVEALIVAGIAYVMMSRAANAPYCSECAAWKSPQLYGPFAAHTELGQMIQSGAITHLAAGEEAAPREGMVTLFACPQCDAQGEVDVLVERWTVNRKGETNRKRIVQMTYPGNALPVLQAVCAPAPAPVAAEPIEEPAESSTEDRAETEI